MDKKNEVKAFVETLKNTSRDKSKDHIYLY